MEIKDFTKKATDWMTLFTSVYVSDKKCDTVHACTWGTLTYIYKGPWKHLYVFPTRT